MLELLINMDAWNSLPKHLQVIIETASKAVNQDMLDEYLAKNNQALTELVEVHGVEPVSYTHLTLPTKRIV